MPNQPNAKRTRLPSYDLSKANDIANYLCRLPVYSFCARQLFEHCRGKRDRECLARVLKFAAITEQNFEHAMALRSIQNANKPTRSAPRTLGASGQKTEKSPAATVSRKRDASGRASISNRCGVKTRRTSRHVPTREEVRRG